MLTVKDIEKHCVALMDHGAADEQHALAPLLATIGELIADYEDVHVAPAAASATEVICFLMTQHGLRQSDLPEIGSQGVVSEVLNGKRAQCPPDSCPRRAFRHQPGGFAVRG